MSGPQQTGGQLPLPSSASLALSAADLTKIPTTIVSQVTTRPSSGSTIVGTTKAPLISHLGTSGVIPRPILAAPTIGSAQLKVIQTSTSGPIVSNQVQLQSNIAPQEAPVDLAAPKNKSGGQSSTTISSVVGHATMQHIPSSVTFSTATPISIATTSPAIVSNVKLGSSTSATPIQTLRIPTIPSVSTLRTGNPQVISTPHVLHGTRTNVTLPRAPGQQALAVALPKSAQGTMPNLAVVHQVPQVGGNKVTVLQQGANIISRGKTTTFQATGTMGVSGATTIIRPQTGASYPVTIRAPLQSGPASLGSSAITGVTSQAIRLTTPVGSGAIGGQASAVHFVPVSLSGQPISSTGTAVRHGSGGNTSSSNLPTVSFRPGQASIVTAPRQTVVAGPGQQLNPTPVTDPSGTVRVTLVQTSMGVGGKAIVSQPTCMSVGSSTQQIYKPVTITTQQPGQTTLGLGSVAGIRTSINTTALVPTPLSVGLQSSSGVSATINTQPVRIGPIAGGTRTFSTSGGTGSQPLTVSISPATVGSHISVPLAPLQAPSKNLRMPVGTAVSAAGKLIQMPIMATSNPPTGVTIQKTTITANPAPRTISLPYGTAQVSAISKPAGHALPVGAITGQAIPVARVCPQPLNIPSASTIASPNLVTITSSTSTAISVSSAVNTNAASSVQVQGLPTTGSVYIARPAQAHAVVPQISSGSAPSQQPVAINLTSAGSAAKILANNQQSSISRVVTSNVPFTYAPAQTTSSGTASSTAQLIASAANALASSAQIQQQISAGSTITTISGAKISLPTQPARFVALPTQPAAVLQQASGGSLGQQAIITGQGLLEHDMQARIASVSSTHPSMTIVSASNFMPSNPNALQCTTNAQIPNSPSRPSILRRREGEREVIGSSVSPSRAVHNLNSMTDHIGAGVDRGQDSDGSSSGSTTLSATSSPGGAGNGMASRIGDVNLSGDEGMAGIGMIASGMQQSSQQGLQPSPRKKPRKQFLPPTNDAQDSSANAWMFDNENQPRTGRNYGSNISSHHSRSELYGDTRRKIPLSRLGAPMGEGMSPQHPDIHDMPINADIKQEEDYTTSSNYLSDKPRMSLKESYRHTWKSRHNHFLRYNDVRVKDDRRPTVNELANTTNVLQKINGWKIYHLSSTMEDIVDVESELTQRLSGLQKRLEKVAHPDLSHRGDLGKVHELIKANLQRSKVIQDQINESKTHALDLFEHKNKVSEIITKYVSKRQVKKRDIK